MELFFIFLQKKIKKAGMEGGNVRPKNWYLSFYRHNFLKFVHLLKK